MKIGIAQLNSNDDVRSNFEQIKQIILSSEKEKPEIIFFPENSLFFRISNDKNLEAISLEDQVIVDLQVLCAKQQVAIHLTTAVKENGKVYNATIFIDKNGVAKTVYKKIHLFDIELQDQKPIRESDVFAGGSETSTIQVADFKIGNSICYDVRFAELYSKYAKQDVDLIVIPAAFLVKTGMVHWDVLLRARAIESQCYVVAPAQAGEHQSSLGPWKRETYGHSMLVSPWGETLALKPDGVGIIYAELDLNLIRNVRKQIPMKNHRRIDF
ncbi:carbon-nitrogen hydrolase family protein [Pseudobdellovibrio exovorus]|uniref:Putative amidohydrolase n=1 Tax=Pseudobdellovibrio exovorus JSS TaxID=1184267 RepID=M4V988_9BACT|nr:carbon-nitrogen hydrolase family protein [Pseudobdellovibrio exovorus]AGH94995.1 putative amidohydrolase [Pseudobdellovibrio exovorus JSS]